MWFSVTVKWDEYLPSLYMHIRKQDYGSIPGEEFEATLGVLDPTYTQEPHKEVEALHQDRTK